MLACGRTVSDFLSMTLRPVCDNEQQSQVMREPVRILSDLHLGHAVSRISCVSRLRPLIGGAGTVVFNGDTWQELSEPWCARSRQMLDELIALCAEERVDAVFLTGNHDPGWEGAGWLELAGGRIVVTHGDGLFASGSPWKREVMGKEKEIERIWNQHPEVKGRIDERIHVARAIARRYRSVEFPSGRAFLARAWDAAMPPRRAWLMLESWWLRPKAACDFLDTYFPKAEAIVFGHFHLHHRWERSGRLIIDTGSFLNPGKAHWVDWSDGWLRRGEVDERAGDFRMGAVLDVWRFDPGPA